MALLLLPLCPWGLSVNIKDTAGCSVLIKQVSVHKQLINKRRPSPLPTCLPVFSILWPVSITAPLPWIAASVYYAHGGYSNWHNDTIVTLPLTPRPSLPRNPGVSWHISGTRNARKKSYSLRFNDSCPVSLQDVMSSLRCFSSRW